MTVRIAPLSPPYSPEVEASLAKWMPPGATAPPLALFRTIAKHERLSERMRGLGATFLGRGSLVPAKTRELLILRTCARCGAEYEWGVHVAAFAAAVGLSDEMVSETARRPPGGAGSLDVRDELAIELSDQLHDASSVSDATWARLRAHFSEMEILEMIAIVGFYHLIAFVANGAGVELEPWAARFP